MNTSAYLLALLALLGTSIYLFQQDNTENFQELQSQIAQFEAYLQTYGLTFESEEFTYRFQVYQDNLNFIRSSNEKAGYEMLGANAYTHMPHKEFVQSFMSTISKNQQTGFATNTQIEDSLFYEAGDSDGDLPDEVDWVAAGAVVDPVATGSCKSSYAIAAAGALSSIQYLSGSSRQLTPLSAQQLIACDTNQGGCQGGDTYYSYLYAMKNGLMSQSAYPYTKTKGKCTFDKSQVVYTPKNAYKITYGKPDVMQQVVAQQPITTSLYAGENEFQFYKGGVKPYSTYCDSTQDPNYNVLITGYNVAADKPYWVIQTGMGSSWGNNGYMNIIKSKGSGQCNMNKYPDFPGNTQ